MSHQRNSNHELLPATRSRTGRLMGVQVVGLGSCVPEQLVRNEDLAALGCDADWILQRTGIRQRRHAPVDVSTGDLAVEAGRRCIEGAGVDRAEVDLVLLGTFTPDLPLPATACMVQDRLGLCAPAVDLQAACASFMYAMFTGMQFVATGSSRLVLVVGADCNSRVVNPADVKTYPLFGDGGGAALLAPGSADQGFLAWAFGADGSGESLLCRRMGGSRLPFKVDPSSNGQHYMYMDGRPIFKWAVRLLNETVREVLSLAALTVTDIDLVVFHQANLRIINSAIEDLAIDPAKVYNNLDRYGNTSSASIPLALDEAQREGRLRRGMHVLLSGFGAGLAWGTAIMRR